LEKQKCKGNVNNVNKESQVMQIDISEEYLPAFLAYLAIGTLYAIRKGTVSADVGIWSLGAPRNWEFLLNLPIVPKELIEVFQTGDELSLIQKSSPEKFDTIIGELINKLEKELIKMQEQNWRLTWSYSN
jgi:hypothetical protein